MTFALAQIREQTIPITALLDDRHPVPLEHVDEAKKRTVRNVLPDACAPASRTRLQTLVRDSAYTALLSGKAFKEPVEQPASAIAGE